MDYSRLPEELRQLDQWVCTWKTSKIPMQATIKKAASSSDPGTWSSFETALQAVQDGHYDNLGFVFNNNGIVGIDIDCGYDDDGFFTEDTVAIARSCQSYMEKSRSGRGVHILVQGHLPFPGRNNGHGIEAYQTKRYFIMTGDILIYDKIIHNQEAIDLLVSKHFPEAPRTAPEGSRTTGRCIYTPQYALPVNGKIKIRPDYPEIPNGMRNMSMTSLAGQLRASGHDLMDILAELHVANQAACKPPLPDEELKTIAHSIMRYDM